MKLSVLIAVLLALTLSISGLPEALAATDTILAAADQDTTEPDASEPDASEPDASDSEDDNSEDDNSEDDDSEDAGKE